MLAIVGSEGEKRRAQSLAEVGREGGERFAEWLAVVGREGGERRCSIAGRTWRGGRREACRTQQSTICVEIARCSAVLNQTFCCSTAGNIADRCAGNRSIPLLFLVSGPWQRDRRTVVRI